MIERLPENSFEEVQTPLLENMVVGVPPVFEGLTRQLDKLVEQPLLGPLTEFPQREYMMHTTKQD
jgi:tubulin gamma